MRVRDSLQALFDSGRVANARVEVIEEGATRTGPVRLRFVVQRQVQIGDVRIELAGAVTGSPISVDEIRARLNFVQPGTRLSKQLILRNADEIQVYLRDRGYFNATVEAGRAGWPARYSRDCDLPRYTWRTRQELRAFDIQCHGL